MSCHTVQGDPRTKYADINLDEFSIARTDPRHIYLEAETLARTCPLDCTHESQFPAAHPNDSRSSFIGALGILPLELLNAVLLDLDLQSLTVLRRVSQRSRLAVDVLPQYQSIRLHGPELLRASLSLRLSDSTTLSQLYGALTTASCFLCGEFGAFIYMLSCSRVCLLCVEQRPELLPLSLSHAKHKYGLNRKAVSSLPTLRSLPGVYSQSFTKHRNRKALVDPTAAEEAGLALHGSREQMAKVAEELKASLEADWQRKRQEYDGKVRSGLRVRRPPRHPNPPVVDGKGGNPLRYMGILQAPWLDRRRGQTETGLWCKGCARGEWDNRARYPRSPDWRRQYSQAEFLQHVQSCEFSQETLASVTGLSLP